MGKYYGGYARSRPSDEFEFRRIQQQHRLSKAVTKLLMFGVTCFLVTGMYLQGSHYCLSTGLFAAAVFWMALFFLVLFKCVNGETRNVGFWLDFTELSVLLTPFPILAVCYGTCLT